MIGLSGGGWRVWGCLLGVLGVLGAAAFAAEVEVARGVPEPLPGNPGNLYVTGGRVLARVPEAVPAQAERWRALDDRGATAATGALETAGNGAGRHADLGVAEFPAWYRVEFLDGNGEVVGWTTAAAVERLRAPTPQDSPICIDTASAWFARDRAAVQEEYASLSALAGINWARDRITWADIEPEKGRFVEQATTYDTSAELLTRHGLKTLQVFHSTPNWALVPELDGDNARRRFPRDLRDLHAFCREATRRFGGQVPAWEPWNEANIDPFGGHTIDEMCALQKAAYWGYRAGRPDTVVCWNVYAGAGNRLHTEGVLLNEAWPYFETYNIHTYNAPDSYRGEFEGARDAASGRPIWLSECGVRVPWSSEAPWGDMTAEDDRRQAQFMAQSYASSLYAGVDRHFFFILGNYLENEVQFGLLRHDRTPRPAYVALAAIGRLLAGARCVGRLETPPDSPVRVYAFRAQPDGDERDVLVAWSNTDAPWPTETDLAVEAAYDYLGRTLAAEIPRALGPEAVFLVAPAGTASRLNLEAPPPRAEVRDGAPSPVVLQVQMPQSATRLASQAHEVDTETDAAIPLFAYHFGEEPVTGTLAVESAPEGWTVTLESEPLRLEPMARRPVALRVRIPSKGRAGVMGDWIRLRGDFGDAGRPVLAFRLVTPMDQVEPAASFGISEADSHARWEDNIVGGSAMTREPWGDAGALFAMRFAKGDPWGYPRLRLRDAEFADAGKDGLALTLELIEGEGHIYVQFIEESGAAYLQRLDVKPGGGPRRVVALFEGATWGHYSQPDPDGVLRPEDIRTVLVGINSRQDSTVRMAVRDLAWVRF